MPGRNLIGDLWRMHPSPDLTALGRSITNRASNPNSPSSSSRASIVCSIPLARRRAKSRFDRSTDNNSRARSQLCACTYVCTRVLTKRFPRSTTWGTLWQFRRRDAIDRSRTRSTRGLLLGVSFAFGPRSDRGHRAFATAAEISNLLAANERPRESAQRVWACSM